MAMSFLPDGTNWYQVSAEQALEALGVDDCGLSSSEAQLRLDTYGYNELKFRRRSSLVRFLLQFHNPLIYVLLVAALVTAIIGVWTDTAVILGCVILNVTIGFVQEGKGESAIEALKNMMVPACTVLRDGKKEVIQARRLVPGDIVILEAGDSVPADLRLSHTKNVMADEAALTGESTPVEKNCELISRQNLAPGDQHCIAFSGTFITRGSATGIVVSTGEQTEFGKIAKLMKETPTVLTPLQRKIADFTKFLIIAILGLAVVNFILGAVFGYTLTYSFLASVALAVAAIPEMLPAIVAAILALAAVAMAKRNALVRKLPAAETLGCATIICSDKTGTLTKNQMTVAKVYCSRRAYRVTGVGYEPEGKFIEGGEEVSLQQGNTGLIETLKAGCLCNNAVLGEDRGC